MPQLFSYRVRHDTGAAPNPFWDICTVVICKSRIRLTAQQNDWIVGTGSANSPLVDMSGKVIYAMKVTQKMTMQDYQAFTQQFLRQKIPHWLDSDLRRRLGDSIYDFSCNPPKLLQSVHTEKNRKSDLGGEYALLSEHFWYFGDQAQPLPADLLGIVKQGQGHRSNSNAPFFDRFLKWLYGLKLAPNELYDRPQEKLFREDIPLTNIERVNCA